MPTTHNIRCGAVCHLLKQNKGAPVMYKRQQKKDQSAFQSRWCKKVYEYVNNQNYRRLRFIGEQSIPICNKIPIYYGVL